MKQAQFGIVDIETTGGSAAMNSITEIAIIIYDGQTILSTYQTLLKPDHCIPLHIQSLTGITNEMVADAPTFSSVASEINQLLKDKIFIAHNVHFDYSFILEALRKEGYQWKAQRLCTVRLARQFFKNLPSYSLGKLCHFLGIEINGRHRAFGDAQATVKLLERMRRQDLALFNQLLVKSTAKEQRLPTNISSDVIENIPFTVGVYLFKNASGKIIYVGKAVNLRKRVLSHLVGNKPDQRRQNFINEICDIQFYETGTELMALLFECNLIKKIWPIYNRALKKFEPKFGLISFEDQKGYLRLAICKMSKSVYPLYYFNSVLESTQFLLQLIKKNGLAYHLCSFYSSEHQPQPSNSNKMELVYPDVKAYNILVNKAIDSLEDTKTSFVIIDKGRNFQEQSFIYFRQNQVYALGFIDKEIEVTNIEDYVDASHLVLNNFYMNNLAINYAKSHPEKVKFIAGQRLE